MPVARARNYLLNVEWLASTLVERPKPFFDVSPQFEKFLDVSQEFAADVILDRIRQACNLGDSVFEHLGHGL
jgi:hypothetical protein